MKTTSSGVGVFFGLNGIETRLFRHLFWSAPAVAKFNTEAAERQRARARVDQIKAQVLPERKQRELQAQPRRKYCRVLAADR